jgi:Possible tRNA binding domain
VVGRVCERCVSSHFVLIPHSAHECGSDFRRRFISLLSYKFREFGSVTALSILEAVNVGVPKNGGGVGDAGELSFLPFATAQVAHVPLCSHVRTSYLL